MEQIVAILTICVTLILGIAGLIVNSLVQRKSNSIKIITQTRLDRRAHTQKSIAELLKLSDPYYISSLSTPEENAQVIRKAAEIASDLRSIYCFYNKADVDLIKSVFQVKDLLCTSLLEGKELSQQLRAARKDLARNVDIYASAEWKRIKLETVGKETNGRKNIESWQSIYDYYRKKFRNDDNEYLFQRKTGEGSEL